MNSHTYVPVLSTKNRTRSMIATIAVTAPVCTVTEENET